MFSLHLGASVHGLEVGRGAGDLACSCLLGLFRAARILTLTCSRLKAGGSQDWLPHIDVPASARLSLKMKE